MQTYAIKNKEGERIKKDQTAEATASLDHHPSTYLDVLVAAHTVKSKDRAENVPCFEACAVRHKPGGGR